MNYCKTHGSTNAIVNELLGLLKRSVLSQPNTLPATKYEAKTTLKKLKLAYTITHSSPKGCVCFYGTHEKVDWCVKCGESKYKAHGSIVVPWKVPKHLPFIPHLWRMYGTLFQANMV
jgi:hypothetical protein